MRCPKIWRLPTAYLRGETQRKVFRVFSKTFIRKGINMVERLRTAVRSDVAPLIETVDGPDTSGDERREGREGKPTSGRGVIPRQ